MEEINPQSTQLRNLNFQSLEVVSRYRDPQLQVTENLFYLRKLSPDTYQCFKIESIFNFKQLVIGGYTGAKNHRMSTGIDISVVRVNQQYIMTLA